MLGNKFVLFSDHQALSFLLSKKNPSVCLQAWLDIIMEFDFDIRRYKEGRSNELADYLSRRPMEEENVVKIRLAKRRIIWKRKKS